MNADFIVANWKANKTEQEAILWLQKFEEYFRKQPLNLEKKEIVVCPPFHVLSVMRKYIEKKELPIRLGAQDISPFGRGAYTGEEPASLLHELIRFCIIGHSERRTYFHEDDDILRKKVEMALSTLLLPIFCVPNPKTLIPEEVKIVAFEPVEAIGTGNPEDPEVANSIAEKIKKENTQVMHVLYGGSVIPENIHDFTTMPNIDGALVGSASLDPYSFFSLLIKC